MCMFRGYLTDERGMYNDNGEDKFIHDTDLTPDGIPEFVNIIVKQIRDTNNKKDACKIIKNLYCSVNCYINSFIVKNILLEEKTELLLIQKKFKKAFKSAIKKNKCSKC